MSMDNREDEFTQLENVNNPDDGSVASSQPATTTEDEKFDKVFGTTIHEQTKDSDANKASSGASGDTNNKGTPTKQVGPVSKAGAGDTQQTQTKLKPVHGMRDAFIHPTGHIVNSKGEIIAQAGKSHGQFLRDLKSVENVREFQTLRSEHAEMKKELDTYKNANLVAQKAGLNAQQVMFGMSLAAAWGQDRKKTLERLLTTAREAGDSLDDLGVGGGGIDMEAIVGRITQLVEDKLKPFSFVVEDRERTTKEAELKREVEAELAEFYTNFPDAETHESTIAYLMREGANQGRPVSKEQAYAMLVRYAAENGLDFTKPLHEQEGGGVVVQRNSNGFDDDDEHRLPPRNNARRGTPPMRGGGGNSRQMQPKLADADASWDSILRDVMAEVNQQR